MGALFEALALICADGFADIFPDLLAFGLIE
jgi:hypothetical protein